MHAQQNDADQAFLDDSALPSTRLNARRSSTTATGVSGRTAQEFADTNPQELHQREPAQAAYNSEPPRRRNRSGNRQSTVTMDSMDYDGNDPWQQVPQHLAAGVDNAVPNSAEEAHSWDADEQFDVTPEAEWGRRSRWSAANMEQGFNDPFHNPNWYEDEPEVAEQSGSSWDDGEESVLSTRESRARSPQDWDWVSPAEARRRKQLQV